MCRVLELRLALTYHCKKSKSAKNMGGHGNASLSTNETSTSTFPPLFSSSALTVYLPAFASACFGCTVSNLVVIALILGHRKLRTACGILIAHSLVTHTALCAVAYPVQALLLGLKGLDHLSIDPQYCDLIMWFQMTCRYASNLIETYIAVNRVVALCWPYKYRSFASRILENSVLFGCWVGSAVMAFLGCFNLGVDYIVLPAGSCAIIQLGQFGMVYFVFGYYLPFGLTGAGYVLVYLKMLLTRRRRIMEVSSTAETAQHQKAAKRRLTTANMMFVAYIWNGMCYLFVPIVMVAMPSFFTAQPLSVLWLGFLPVLGYTTEPMIFFLMNKEYRTEFSRTVEALTLRANNLLSQRNRPNKDGISKRNLSNSKPACGLNQ